MNDTQGNEENNAKPIGVHWSATRRKRVHSESGSAHKMKTIRFYIWNINKHTSTEKHMRQIFADRNIHVTLIRYYDKELKPTASAQVNVSFESGQPLFDSNFWPVGIKARRWLPREQFLRSKRESAQ